MSEEDAETTEAADPDAELDEVLAATASDRRLDGLKMCGGGIAALALSGVMYWATGDGSGELSRLLVLILTYASLFLGILLSIFGTTLVINSYYVEP